MRPFLFDLPVLLFPLLIAIPWNLPLAVKSVKSKDYRKLRARIQRLVSGAFIFYCSIVVMDILFKNDTPLMGGWVAVTIGIIDNVMCTFFVKVEGDDQRASV